MAKQEFSINALLNQETLKEATVFTKKIHYSKLLPNTNNTYSMDKIEELADSIQDVGLLQNLVAKVIDGSDEYILVAGHRRREAIRVLVEERQQNQFEMVDTMIIPSNEDETLTSIKLHVTNVLTRELSPTEKINAVAALKELFLDAKAKGYPIKGKIRDLIASQVGLGHTQVQKMLTIDEKADDQTKEALNSGEITVEQAYVNAVSPKTVVDNTYPLQKTPRKQLNPLKELKKLEKTCMKVLDQFYEGEFQTIELEKILGQVQKEIMKYEN